MKKAYPENYNSPGLVDVWNEYIDWKLRRKGENGFLVKKLRANGGTKVLDASLGDGCDSIYLLKEGFDVTSNEIDSVFIEKAVMNARKNKVDLKLTNYDWGDFGKKFAENSFDAIILLGNSLTYLFDKKDRLKTLKAFNRILKKGGILLIDERNYQRILDTRKQILKGEFQYSKKYVYCGKLVDGVPVEISDKKIGLDIRHKNGQGGKLFVYPFKKGELYNLLLESGFEKIETYSDYKKGYDYNSDFIQHIAVK